jgi:N-acetyl-anhydromuramyl-L-alanine amidase AmpD
MDRRHIVAHSTYAPTRRTDPGEVFDWTKIGLPAELPKD